MEQMDEITNCGLCGKQFSFSKAVAYYIHGEPRLLCPECIETKDTPTPQKGKKAKGEAV